MTDRLKLLTLNTWGRTAPWPSRRTLIAEGIRTLDPHVVALNEVWNDHEGNVADEIARAIGGVWHIHHAAAYRLGPARTCGNAVMSRFPIVSVAAWPLTVPTGDQDRNLVHAMVATPWGSLPVFVTHLSWMFHQGAARLLQLRQVLDRIQAYAPIQKGDQPGELLPPVLMGDLNSEPDSDEIRLLRGLAADPRGCYLADCFAIRGTGSGHTWHRNNAYAAREHYPDRRIDYIFVRGPDRWYRGEPLAARVVLDGDRDGVFASDHYGVYAEVRAAPISEVRS